MEPRWGCDIKEKSLWRLLGLKYETFTGIEQRFKYKDKGDMNPNWGWELWIACYDFITM